MARHSSNPLPFRRHGLSGLGLDRYANLLSRTLFVDIRCHSREQLRMQWQKVAAAACCLAKAFAAHVELCASLPGSTPLSSVDLNLKTKSAGLRLKERGIPCTRHHAIDWNFVGAPRSR